MKRTWVTKNTNMTTNGEPIGIEIDRGNYIVWIPQNVGYYKTLNGAEKKLNKHFPEGIKNEE